MYTAIYCYCYQSSLKRDYGKTNTCVILSKVRLDCGGGCFEMKKARDNFLHLLFPLDLLFRLSPSSTLLPYPLPYPLPCPLLCPLPYPLPCPIPCPLHLSANTRCTGKIDSSTCISACSVKCSDLK